MSISFPVFRGFTQFCIAAFGLLMTVSASQVQAADACQGKNLLPDLQKNSPALYEKALQEANATPNGKSKFWKIEKTGVKPSWIFGTMHVSDPSVLTMPAAAEEARHQADTIAVELTEIMDEKQTATALFAKPELTILPDNKTISDLLSKEDAQRLDEGLKTRGLSLAVVSRMQPWMIYGFLSISACETQRQAAGSGFLDKKIALDAQQEGKQVKGLETFIEQAQALSSVPNQYYFEALFELFTLGNTINDFNETVKDLYVEGNVGLIVPTLKAASLETLNDADYAAFEKKIVLDRNKLMAKRAAPLLEKGNVFIAVGALHLPGEEGLVELFRKQGYSVSAIP